jgi:hypothetical protein
MNLKFIESRQAGYKVVEFRGVRIVDEEIVYGAFRQWSVCDGEKSMGVEVSENPCWVRRATRRSWDKSSDWGRPGTV